jgi:hypothetical protein
MQQARTRLQVKLIQECSLLLALAVLVRLIVALMLMVPVQRAQIEKE